VRSLWQNLLIFFLGLVLGYVYALRGGAHTLADLAERLPWKTATSPTGILGLIILVVIVLVYLSRRK
jgi:uncharacterized membrane protein YpjA